MLLYQLTQQLRVADSKFEADLEPLVVAMTIGMERVLEYWDAEKGSSFAETQKELILRYGKQMLEDDAQKLYESIKSCENLENVTI